MSGYTTRHIRRLLGARLGRQSTESNAFAVTEAVVTAVFLMCGCLAGAHRLLLRNKVPLPSLSTFKRHVKKQMGTDQLAYARGGSAAYRDHQVYMASDYPHRLYAVLMDHTELPIWVVPQGHTYAVKPYMTAVMDAKTRYVLSWTITFGRPTAAEVRAALISAMTLRAAPDGVTIVGGRPLKAIWDRGLEFLSQLITESCLRLDILPVALPAYSPHLKGRLERFWGFLKRDCLSPLPGYSDGPRDLRGRSAIAAVALSEDEFLEALASWMDWYVSEHPVDGGATPLARWRADGCPITEIEPERLWVDMLIAKDRCKVSKEGIHFKGKKWTAPELNGMVGRSVEIRYLPHDDTFIEVFADNEHTCTAVPVDSLTEEQQQEFAEYRKARRNAARGRFTTANRQRHTNATGPLHPLEAVKNGKRVVAETIDDLLEGGEQALMELVGDLEADLDQGRLF